MADERFFITALGIGQICSWGTLYYSFPQVTEAMALEFGWSRAEQYGPLTFGLVLSAMLSYPIGAAIDRGYGRVILAGASLAAGLLMGLWSLVSTLAGFYLIFAGIAALFAATLYEPAFAVVGRRVGPAHARRGITALTLWGGFASTVFVPLIELVMDVYGWRAVLWLLALVNIGICAPLYATAIRPRLDKAKDTDRTVSTDGGRCISPSQESIVRRLVGRPVFWFIAVFFIAQAALMSAFIFHLYPLLLERGLGAQDVVMVIAVIGPAQVAGRLAISLLANNASITAIGAVTVGVMLVVFAALAFLDAGLATIIAIASAYGAANGVMTIVRGLTVPELLTTRFYGTINGLLAAPSTIAKALAPVGAAYLWDLSGSYELVVVALLFGALIMSSAYWGAILIKATSDRAEPNMRHRQ
ncbi:MFS transporter [Kaustia mangrovi]|uniref:MFS transporter n=2 Tax=Kaustia mangrovi TaxID=2593653 RepID=A0A7S8HE87_9HYPH|nr:MFS transporter [Kaustia mangrovi]